MQSIGSMVAGYAYGKKIAPEAIEMVERNRERFIETCSLCESPIEQIMLSRLCDMQIEDTTPAIHDIQSGEEYPNCRVVITPQFPIARFRLDFLVEIIALRRAWLFDIECDGKEHHTKLEDRQRDYDRDTYLARLGIRTFRYFGQEICRGDFNPEWDMTGHIGQATSNARAA